MVDAVRPVWCGTYGATTLSGGVQGTVLWYEGSDVRTVNGFVLPRDRGLEYASLKYRRRNSVIIIASLLEYKRALLYILQTLTPTVLPLLLPVAAPAASVTGLPA